MDIQVLDANPIYANHIFRLSFIFSNNYPIGTNPPTLSSPHLVRQFILTIPIEAPEVSFLRISPEHTQSTPNLHTQPSSQASPIDLTSDTPTTPTTRPIPLHPHIYSNGIICLDLLGSAGWSPVQSVESVCMSIQSMLTGNTRRERPEGDEEFCRSMGVRGPNGWSGSARGWAGGGGRGLKDVRFVYDDNTV